MDKPASTTRFWIEPWGNEVLSADGDDFQYQFKDKLASSKHKISYRVVIQDGGQKNYRSNQIVLRDPNIKLLKSFMK